MEQPKYTRSLPPVLFLLIVLATGASSVDAQGRATGPPAAGAQQPITHGRWSVIVSDRVGEGARATAVLEADRPVGTQFKFVVPRLTLRCGSAVEASIAFDALIEDEAWHRVRIDNGPAREDRGWFLGVRADSLIASEPLELMRSLEGAALLRFSFRPNGYGEQIVTFTMTGVDEVIATLRRTCRLTTP